MAVRRWGRVWIIPKKFGVEEDVLSSPAIDPVVALEQARADYQELLAKDLALDLTRGKPSAEQLDLSEKLISEPMVSHNAADGTDCRNYGGLMGLPELRDMFSPLLGVPTHQLALGGNSSLELMHTALVSCLLNGPAGADQAWSSLPLVKFLCPTPGYDRHYSLCAHFGIEMVSVPMTGSGPDMAVVKELVANDASIKGMWCVPQYSNPTGEVYSAEVVQELASMPTAASDFRLFWDNAYAVHHLESEFEMVPSILTACEEHGNPLRPLMFASTSKVTWAGSGVAFFGGSPQTVAWWQEHAKVRTIGPDKVSQLRHAALFGNTEGVLAHMAKHAEVIRPKFEAVQEALSSALTGTGLAMWTKPAGGYFVSVDVLPGCASRTIALAAEAGINLTPANSTFPGIDPHDSNIRLAPTYPTLAQVREAMAGVAVCIRLAGFENLAAGAAG